MRNPKAYWSEDRRFTVQPFFTERRTDLGWGSARYRLGWAYRLIDTEDGTEVGTYWTKREAIAEVERVVASAVQS